MRIQTIMMTIIMIIMPDSAVAQQEAITAKILTTAGKLCSVDLSSNIVVYLSLKLISVI